MSLYIVPAANPAAMRNLDATVASPIGLSLLAGLRKPTIDRARAAGDLGAWGTQPGDSGVNVATWKTMAPGDWVLFYSRGHFPYAGRVLARERSARVAKKLWGTDATGTWEYMYLLEDVRRIDAPLLAVIAALEFRDGFRPQRFSRVAKLTGASPGRIEGLIETLSREGAGLGRAIEAAAEGDDAAVAVAIDSLGPLSEEALAEAVASHDSSAPPAEREARVKRLARNQRLVVDLKALYGGRCQCCGFTFAKKDGSPYSEAAHIRRISLRKADLDVKDNLLVLCPNHHKMLDHGPLEIRFDPASGRLIREEDGKAKRIVNKHVGKGLAGAAAGAA